MAVTGSASLTISATQTSTRDLGSASDAASLTASLSLIAGASGAGAVDRVFSDTRTLAPSANEDLDLVGAALLDAFGAAAAFAKVKAIAIKAAPANTNNVVVGAAASNAWTGLLNSTGTITLRPGAVFTAFVGSTDTVGWATVAATGDLLRVTNSAGTTSVDYSIVILGTVA